MRLFSRLQNSPYFCVFKYARAVKQEVWNETENREWDSSHARRALRARKTDTTLYRFLYWFWEKNRLSCSLVIQRCVEHVNCQLQSRVFFLFAVLSLGTSCFSKLAPWSLGFLGKSPDNNNNNKKNSALNFTLFRGELSRTGSSMAMVTLLSMIITNIKLSKCRKLTIRWHNRRKL